MGKFIWHQWAQYVLIFASVYTIWASFWGMFFRKFFWDFVNGTNMPGPNHINGRPCFDDNPCGIVPARQDQIFVNLIVNQPIVQILAMIFGITHLVIECVPAVSKMSIYRSFPLKIVTLAIQAFLTCLFYQGTNGAIYSTTAMIGYIVATIKGEEMEVAKDNRGKGGRA